MNHDKHVLGKLCRHGHESSPDSRQSWRYPGKFKIGACVECHKVCTQRWGASDAGRESARKSLKRYRKSEKGKARQERHNEYRRTPEGSAKQQAQYLRYKERPEGQKARNGASSKYRSSSKGKETKRVANRRYRKENKEKLLAYARHRRVTDPVFALTCRLRVRLATAFSDFSTKGKLCSSDEYGIDYGAIIEHLGPCPGPRTEWHIDHIRPLVSFDWDDPTTPRKAFAPTNHQWLPAEDNRSKGAKWEGF